MFWFLSSPSARSSRSFSSLSFVCFTSKEQVVAILKPLMLAEYCRTDSFSATIVDQTSFWFSSRVFRYPQCRFSRPQCRSRKEVDIFAGPKFATRNIARCIHFLVYRGFWSPSEGALPDSPVPQLNSGWLQNNSILHYKICKASFTYDWKNNCVSA